MFFNLFPTATAHIKGSSKYPKIDGIVTFKETKEGVLLTAKIHHLPHSKDKCTRKILWFSYP